ncbi:primosomal protein N', partial [bacterium]|nr:primosomal protein N' [bacterium]
MISKNDFQEKEIDSSTAKQSELFDLSPPPWELADEPPVTLATVVFSEPPHGPYDYLVPEAKRAQLQPGMRVKVPLGNRRQPMISWCTKVETTARGTRSLREISEIMDEQPLCDPALVRLVLWMSHYYQAPAGQVFDTLIPSSVRSLAGTREKIYYQPTGQAKDPEIIDQLPIKQKAIIEAMIRIGQPMTGAQLMLQAKCSQDPIKRLLKKELINAESRREMSSST